MQNAKRARLYFHRLKVQHTLAKTSLDAREHRLLYEHLHV